MNSMFEECSSLNNLDLKIFNSKKIIDNIKIFISNPKITPNKKNRQEKDNKFNIENYNKDTIIEIKDKYSKNLFTEDFSKKIFSDDLEKIIEAIKDFKSFIDENNNNNSINIFLDNLDIILKILCQKIYNNQNPSLTKIFIEFLQKLLNLVNNKNYIFNEIESFIIISLLIGKLTISNNFLKESLFNIIKDYIENIGPNKITLFMINYSLTIENFQIKSDVLEIVNDLYLNKKIDIINKEYIKPLSKFITIKENNIQVISLLKEIFFKIWR